MKHPNSVETFTGNPIGIPFTFSGLLSLVPTQDSILLMHSLDDLPFGQLKLARCIVVAESVSSVSHTVLLLNDLCIPIIASTGPEVFSLAGTLATFYIGSQVGRILSGQVELLPEPNHPFSELVFASSRIGMAYHAQRKSRWVIIRGEFLRRVGTGEKQDLRAHLRDTLAFARDSFDKVVYRFTDSVYPDQRHHTLDKCQSKCHPAKSEHYCGETSINSSLGRRGAQSLLGWNRPMLDEEIELLSEVFGRSDRLMAILPFVRSPEEGRELAKLIRTSLGGQVPVGCMIEVPSMLFRGKQLSAIFDFFGIGTKDLAQLLSGADRDDADLEYPVADLLVELLAGHFLPSIGKKQQILIPDQAIYEGVQTLNRNANTLLLAG